MIIWAPLVYTRGSESMAREKIEFIIIYKKFEEKVVFLCFIIIIYYFNNDNSYKHLIDIHYLQL